MVPGEALFCSKLAAGDSMDRVGSTEGHSFPALCLLWAHEWESSAQEK